MTADTATSIAREARQLLRAHRYGALGTLSAKFGGHPFGSITPYLTDHDGSLLIFISSIAEHTKNILADPRVSLITHNQDDPQIQTQGRVTLMGNAERDVRDGPSASRYLRHFPEAQGYLQMHDFSFYRIRPLAIRYIGGFGRIHWVSPEEFTVPAHALPAQEDGILAHMNADHRDSLRSYCLTRGFDAADVEMIGIDCDGFDVRADGRVLRFDFAEPVLDAQRARTALVEMAKEAG